MADSNSKVVLITGASTGIGHASAELLLKQGFTVYAAARRTHLMEDLKEAGAKILSCDVTKDADVQAAVDEIIANEGRIDVLFANAGYCLLGPVELQKTEDVIHQFDVNVFGNSRVIAAVLPHMRKARSGRILITSSAAGHVSMPGLAYYSATKHAQQGIGHGLRMEVEEFGVKVALIEPGYIDTDIDNASLPSLAKAEQNAKDDEYKAQITTFRKKWSEGIDNGASPMTIARAVLHAATAAKPRRQYRPNADARAAVIMKRLFGYGLIDKLVPGQSIR